LALVACLIAPAAASAQEPAAAPTAPQREGWALVGIFAPGLQRIGLLIPVRERILLRPDIAGHATSYDGSDDWFANPGISLIVRTRPTEAGWVYVSLRAAYSVDAYWTRKDWANHFTLTAGGHAKLSPKLSAFGETGIGYTYDEDGPDDPIYRTYDFVARFGFALSRPPKR
jgi:hypothetical protein